MILFSDSALAHRCVGADIAAALEFVDTLHRLRGTTQLASEAISGGLCVFAGAESPITRAIGLGMHGAVSDEEFYRMERFFLDRDCAPHLVLSPFAHPSMLGHINAGRYLVHSIAALYVLPLGAVVTRPVDDDMVIYEPDGDEEDLWRTTLNRGFIETGDIPDTYDDISLADFHMPSTRRFLARIDGEPAGAACLSVHNGMATLFGTSTLPAFRGRGVQTAMIAHRLRVAGETGCDMVQIVVRPDSAAQRNAERFGFRMVSMNIRFAWNGPVGGHGRS